MIDSVRETVHDFLEKNNRGWLKPERFNNYAYLAQMEIFESYFYDYSRWQVAEVTRNSASQYANIPRQLREKIEIFHKIGAMTNTTGSRFTAPTDAYKVMDIYYGGEIVELLPATRIVMLERSNLTAPTTDYPVANKLEDEYLLYPSTITSGVTCSYIRKPADPNWTYTVTAGNPVFNASAVDYQDFEIHPSDEPRLIVKILEYAGVSVREQEVIQYAEAQEMEKKQNESRR